MVVIAMFLHPFQLIYGPYLHGNLDGACQVRMKRLHNQVRSKT